MVGRKNHGEYVIFHVFVQGNDAVAVLCSDCVKGSLAEINGWKLHGLPLWCTIFFAQLYVWGYYKQKGLIFA